MLGIRIGVVYGSLMFVFERSESLRDKISNDGVSRVMRGML
jgi:hypothetical protein